MAILIGTPAYNNQLHTGFLHTILDIERNRIPFSLFTLGNESLITRARNTILAYYCHHQDQFSHLLFMDADIQFPASGLQHLLDMNKDVIGAPVPLKSRSADNKPVFNIGMETRPTETETLFVTNYIGTAVLMLSRRAVQALVKNARKEGRMYKNDSQYLGNEPWTQQEAADVFRVGVMDNIYYSEDFRVCLELRELGFEIFVDNSVKVVHHGMAPFLPE